MDKDKFLWVTGEKAPAGFYCCVTCNSDSGTISHEYDGEKLPACKTCGKTTWAKI